MHARKTRLPARPRVRVRAREEPANPSRPETISPGKRLFSPGRPGFLGLFAPVRRPTAALFAPVTALFAEIFPETPAPVAFLRRQTRLFRPNFARSPRHTAPDRAPVCGFSPGGSAFRPGNATRRPVFAPATPYTARLFAPVTPALTRPGTPARLPRPGQSGLRPAPTQTSPLRRGEGLCDPQGASDPWPLRLETAAQVRVKFREIGAPGVYDPGDNKKPPRRAARRYR